MKGEIFLPFADGDAPVERRRLSRPITVSLIVLSLLSCSYFFSRQGSHPFGRGFHHGGEHGHACEGFHGPPPPHFNGLAPPPPFDGHFPPPPPHFHHHGHEDGMPPPPPPPPFFGGDDASHWHMPPPPPRPWWKFWGPPPPPPHSHHHGHKKHMHCRDMQLIGDAEDNAEQVCAFDFISEKEDCNVYVVGLVGKSSFEGAILSESEACQVYGYDESVDKFGDAVPLDSDRAHIIKLEDSHGDVLSAVLATAEGKFIDILKVGLSDNADLMELDNYLSGLLEQRKKAQHHHKKPEQHRKQHDEPKDEDKKPKRPYPPPPPHERRPHHPPHHGPPPPFGQLLLTADASLDVKPVLEKISKLGMASFYAGETASGSALEFDFMAPPPPPPHHRPHHGHHDHQEPEPEDPEPEDFEQEAPMQELV
ncbi:hypothetical protein CYLTODRAFT_490227 [Cylindrobasidium torrendii FP15055 ss-10]|uniref:Uncharacterized protein n=1 Tax=Cylindrobasidium torrendii FP15055 ss-10 TaxID=1314674 RepID=A0A0D7BCK6_9AGAR|nr:hypothetical protein CYLTODRAFT_490227 [Cylindrobasidium torrendii FP15055 ss-10]